MKHGKQAKTIAAGVIVAMLSCTLAYPQEANAPLTSVSSAAGKPASPSTTEQFHDANIQLPDSPGAILTSSARLQAPQSQDRPSHSPGSTSDQNQEQQSHATDEVAPGSLSSKEPQESDRTHASSTDIQNSQPSAPQVPREPVGTAAAETLTTTGVAASRPAGFAVAPAKQQRVRSILIKVGAVAGAAVAIGATMALSQGSPSRPPGTH